MNKHIAQKTWLVAFIFGVTMLNLNSAIPMEQKSKLSDLDQAKALVAHHLLSSVGTEKFTRAVESKDVKTEQYWKNIFTAENKTSLYPAIGDLLKKEIGSIPLIQGRAARPEIFARALLGSLRPLPLIPLTELPLPVRKTVLEFARGSLKRFSDSLYQKSTTLNEEAVELTMGAGDVFRSVLITEEFNRFTQFSSEFHLQQKELELIESKDKLNSFLHLYGLHLVIDGNSLSDGLMNLSTYMVMNSYSYVIQKKPFTMYEVQPLVEETDHLSLGHAETESGFLFLFSDHVDQEVKGVMNFLNRKALSTLWKMDALGNPLPISELTKDSLEKIESEVRANIEGAGFKNGDVKWLREKLIDSIGHHEGFHSYIRDALRSAVKTGKIDAADESTAHERGAYLYQLETSEPVFISLDLFLVLSTALETNSLISDNRRGAVLAMTGLQKFLPKIHFWTESGQPIPEGLPALFGLPPQEIKAAAGQARWDFEMQL